VQRASNFSSGFEDFPEASGLYNGLIAPTDEVVPERSGSFRVSVSSSRCFSGQFAVGGDTVPLHGRFNSQGRAGVSIYFWVWDDCLCFRYLVLEWVVDLELVADSDELVGTVVNVPGGGWSSDLYGLRAHYRDSSIPAPHAGRYTMRLPGSANPFIAPPGDGYGTLTVDSRGAIQMSGMLPDGVDISDSAYISVDGFWPLNRTLNDGHGILFGWIQFTVAGSKQMAGELTWIKPRNEGRNLYPNGFQGTIAVTGGTYSLPSGSDSPFSWVDGIFQVAEGGVGGILANNVSFLSATKIEDQGGDLSGLKIKLNGKTGRLSGSFTHPVTNQKTSFGGAVFQFEDAGGGYFLGKDIGGIVRLISR
jgi:hypothetical protein